MERFIENERRCGICSAQFAMNLESHIKSLAQLSLQRRSRRWTSLKKLKNLKRRGINRILSSYLGKDILDSLELNGIPFCLDCLLLFSQIESFNAEFHRLMKKRKILEKKFNLELLSGARIATTNLQNNSSLRNNLIELLQLKEDYYDESESEFTGSDDEEFLSDEEESKREKCKSFNTSNSSQNFEFLPIMSKSKRRGSISDPMGEKEPKKKKVPDPPNGQQHIEPEISINIPHASDLIVESINSVNTSSNVQVKPERAFNFFNESFESEIGPEQTDEHTDHETSNSYEEFEANCTNTNNIDFEFYLQNCITENGFKCYVCSNEYGNRIGIKRHFVTKHQLPTHECEICSKRFSRKDVYQKHMKMHTKRQIQMEMFERMKKGDELAVNGQFS